MFEILKRFFCIICMRSPNDDNNKCVCVCVKLISIYLSIYSPFFKPKNGYDNTLQQKIKQISNRCVSIDMYHLMLWCWWWCVCVHLKINGIFGFLSTIIIIILRKLFQNFKLNACTQC